MMPFAASPQALHVELFAISKNTILDDRTVREEKFFFHDEMKAVRSINQGGRNGFHEIQPGGLKFHEIS